MRTEGLSAAPNAGAACQGPIQHTASSRGAYVDGVQIVESDVGRSDSTGRARAAAEDLNLQGTNDLGTSGPAAEKNELTTTVIGISNETELEAHGGLGSPEPGPTDAADAALDSATDDSTPTGHSEGEAGRGRHRSASDASGSEQTGKTKKK